MLDINGNMIKQLKQKFSTNGQIDFAEVGPGFPVIQVNNKHAKACISLYGGQLLSYQPHEQSQPVIWLSDKAVYKHDKAIRGGIPVCWPWFGDNSHYPQQPAHGFARIAYWEIESINNLVNGATEIALKMLCQTACQNYQSLDTGFNLELTMRFTIGRQLEMVLTSINLSRKQQVISNALHSYFQISHIENVTVEGLNNVTYLDKLLANKAVIQAGELQICGETDRVYIDTDHEVHLLDPGFNRKVTVSKQHALSTVIWNPWKEKSHSMSDMPDDGWRSMLCIESANVADNIVAIDPGQKQQLTTTISVADL